MMSLLPLAGTAVSVHVGQMLHIITHEMLFYSLTKLEGIVLAFYSSVRMSIPTDNT